MLMSMTGFGRGESRSEQGSLQVEIRSVNHRYSEISIRLPKVLAMLEGRVRERIQDRLSRGKVNVSVWLEGEEGELGRLTLNREVAGRFFDILKTLKSDVRAGRGGRSGRLPESPRRAHLGAREPGRGNQGWALLAAGAGFRGGGHPRHEAARGREPGPRPAARASPHVAVGLPGSRSGYPAMVAALRERLDGSPGRGGTATWSTTASRLETEIVLFADRTDCTEECVRLRSHLRCSGSSSTRRSPRGAS